MENIFKYGQENNDIIAEARTALEIEKVEYKGGIKLYIKGAKYPLKGMPTPAALNAINIVKKILLEPIKLKTFILAIFFTKKEKLINAFNQMAWRVMSPYILKEEYRQEITNELDNMIYTALKEYGITEQNAIQTAQILSHIVEYDAAYRLRLQDMFTTSSKESFLNDFSKLCKKIAKRDSEEVGKKIMLFGRVFKWLLLLSKMRKVAFKTLKQCDYNKLKFSNGDYYWALQRIDYNVSGLDYEKRKEIMKQMGYEIVEVQYL